MTNIISFHSCVGCMIQLSWKVAEMNYGLVITFRITHPHNLHLIIVVGKTDMNLLMSCPVSYFDFGNLHQLFQTYELIFIQVN